MPLSFTGGPNYQYLSTLDFCHRQLPRALMSKRALHNVRWRHLDCFFLRLARSIVYTRRNIICGVGPGLRAVHGYSLISCTEALVCCLSTMLRTCLEATMKLSCQIMMYDTILEGQDSHYRAISRPGSRYITPSYLTNRRHHC